MNLDAVIGDIRQTLLARSEEIKKAVAENART